MDDQAREVVIGNALELSTGSLAGCKKALSQRRRFIPLKTRARAELCTRSRTRYSGGIPILVGIERQQTAYFYVEGSSLLWDELCAYRGLDEADLKTSIWSQNTSAA